MLTIFLARRLHSVEKALTVIGLLIWVVLGVSFLVGLYIFEHAYNFVARVAATETTFEALTGLIIIATVTLAISSVMFAYRRYEQTRLKRLLWQLESIPTDIDREAFYRSRLTIERKDPNG